MSRLPLVRAGDDDTTQLRLAPAYDFCPSFERFVLTTSASGSRPGALRGHSQLRACACMTTRREPPASRARRRWWHSAAEAGTYVRTLSVAVRSHTHQLKRRVRSAQRSMLSARVVYRLSALADRRWHLLMRVYEPEHGALKSTRERCAAAACPTVRSCPPASRAAPGQAGCPAGPAAAV